MLLSKTLRAVILFLLFSISAFANNIIIVESQSYHTAHIMDQEWLNIATYSGDVATIHPQSVLTDPIKLAEADVLIISSAVILLDDTKVDNILTFIENGGNVYLQSEFTASLAGNIAFQQIATDLGVTFNWENEFPGYVMPIVLDNSLADYSDTPVEFAYWFYAGSGSGDENVEVIADLLGEGVGFSIQSPIAGQGKIVTLSDQDWIRQQVDFDALDYLYQFLNTAPFIDPEIEIQATNMAACPGDIVSFTAMIEDVPTPNTLNWFINGVLLPGVNSISFSTAPAAGDVIKAEVTFTKPSGTSCVVGSNEIIVPPFNQPPAPMLTMTVNTTDLCGNETAFFNTTIDNSTGLSNLSYTWRVNGQIASITPSMNASIGNFLDGAIVTCDMTYDTPCDNGEIVTSNGIIMNVTTPVTPTIVTSGNTTICSGDLIELEATGNNWGTNPTFEWFVDGISAGQTTTSFSAANLVDGQIITCEVLSSVDCVTTNTAVSNNAVVEVTTTLNPTITITASPEVCPGEIITYTVTGNQWSDNAITEWFIDGIATGNNTTTLSEFNLSPGQLITCELSNLSDCSSVTSLTSNELTVTFATPIVPTINIMSTPTGCEGEDIIYTASGTNWDPNAQLLWYIDGFSTGNTTNEMHVNNVTAGQIINFEISNLNSCYSASSEISNGLIVEFLPKITPTINITASPVGCPGEPITFTASGTDWDPNATFEWFINGIPTGNNTDEFTASNFLEDQVITAELSNLSSCYTVNELASNNLTVEFSPSTMPTIGISVSPEVCPGEMMTYTATGTNWDPNATFEWYIDGVATGNNTDVFAASNFVAGQIITCELSNLSDCYSVSELISNNLTVGFLPSIMPSIEITASPEVCQGELITYTATGANWDPNATLEWFIDGTATGNNTDELSASNFVAGQIITCELSNLSDCYSVSELTSNNLTVTFSTIFFPSIAISVIDQGCPGETITFNAIGTDWESTSALEWFVDGVSTGIMTDEFSTNNLVAGQEITCVVSNLSSCANTNSLTSNNLIVAFAPPVIPTITITTNNNSICENEMTTLSATGNDWGTNYQLTWFVDGQMVGSTNDNLDLNISSENQVITAEIISGDNCADGTAVLSNPISFDFIQTTQPTVSIEVDAFNCMTNNYSISATGENLGNNTAYKWFVDDIEVAETDAILEMILMPGQTVSVILETDNECTTVSANSNAMVIELIELTATIAELGDAHCMGGNGFARLATTGGQGPYTYLWSDNDTNEFRTAIEAGSYQVTVTDANGCEDQIAVEIAAQAGPQIQEIEVNDVRCSDVYGSAFIFVDSDHDVVINWKNEDNQILSTEEMVTNLIVGKYHVEISDASGCFDVREFEVKQMTAPDLDIEARFEIKTGESIELIPYISNNQNTNTFEWSPAIGLSCADCENPIATPFTTTTYTLKVTTIDGCVNSTSTTMYVAESSNVYVPNIFSPNGDGINDHLLVFGGQEVVQINSMMVFNRIGETIFSKNNIQPNDAAEGWDGTFKGKQVQSGVYIYFTEVEFIDGRVEVFKGDVFVTP